MSLGLKIETDRQFALAVYELFNLLDTDNPRISAILEAIDKYESKTISFEDVQLRIALAQKRKF